MVVLQVVKTDAHGQEKFGGPLWDFFDEALKSFQPRPVVRVIPGWASQQSRPGFVLVVKHGQAFASWTKRKGERKLYPQYLREGKRQIEGTASLQHHAHATLWSCSWSDGASNHAC